MRHLLLTVVAIRAFATSFGGTFAAPDADDYPQTWFHVIGGNLSKTGLTADLEAIKAAGLGGIQFFHGQVGKAFAWPRTHDQIPCLSAKWDDHVAYLADECARLGLKFEMQNCPGWSMSGGPWVTPDKAMRQLVAFERDRRPAFDADDDFREIGEVSFPRPAGWGTPEPVAQGVETNGATRVFTFASPVTLRQLILPPSRDFTHDWVYERFLHVRFEAETAAGWRAVVDRPFPRGCWQDKRWSTTFALEPCTARRWRLTLTPQRKIENPAPSYVRFSSAARLDGWETLGGWVMRDLPREGTAAAHYATETGRVTMVFGHVNNKFKNAPAPAEATGWECDKLDPEGFRNHFAGYLGRLLTGPLANGKLKGFVVDSWECGRQTWTPKMAQYFREINGYELRPHLPTLFGWPAESPADAERFLRDWRRTLSTLVEENYYRVLAETGHAHGLAVQFETAFGDVLPGDPLRYWKYADIPMCEFWLPFDNAKGSVGSDNFKPVRSCVSGAHLYGKRRVQAEAFTTVRLNWDENFRDFKALADRHFARGVTHVVCHTYTHNPQAGADFVAPGTSFGGGIGSPFVRGQTWWGFMPELTRYLARCGHMLERGKPVVDVLWYLGDALGHRPDENAPFPIGYKYDYCTYDALVTRVDVKNGRLVLPDGMSYRVLWVPSGTFLLPATERRLAALAQKGARIIRGDLKPDWPSELTKIGEWPAMWYQRRDGDEDIFFIARNSGESEFVCVKDGVRRRLDPLTGEERAAWRDVVSTAPSSDLALKPCADCPTWATNRLYAASFVRPAKGSVVLDLGEVRDWAEVSVNGRPVARLWCAPYVCDLTPYLRDGTNAVSVNVTSTWYNRLVHEAALPETARTAWTLGGPKADAAPHPAGLLGPARLVFPDEGPNPGVLPRRIDFEGEYKDHLQDVCWDGTNTIWWAHTYDLLKTDRCGRILAHRKVRHHHAGIELHEGRLYVAVCDLARFNGDGKRPTNRVQVNVYDPNTLALLEERVTDVLDSAGSLCFLADGTLLVGCLRPPDIRADQIRFHRFSPDFKLISTHVLDNVKIPMGIEVIKRHRDRICLGCYSPGGLTIVLDGQFREIARHRWQTALGWLYDGTACLLAHTTPGSPYRSSLVRETWCPVMEWDKEARQLR